MTLLKRTLSNLPPKQPAPPDGFSLLELMIVVAVLVVVLALAIPSLLGGRRAAYENTAKQKLASIAQQQTAFKTLLRKGRYGSIAELQATIAGGSPLLTAADTNVNGWAFSDEGVSSATAFAAKITPTADNPATYSYYISEDQILRRCARTGPWSKSCTATQQ
jgi:prepilin-type N-terminal cleavage/methylation domain-containing protein